MNPSRETKFSGTNVDREIFIILVQLTTCKIGTLARLIHTLAICVTDINKQSCKITHLLPVAPVVQSVTSKPSDVGT